MSHFFGYLIDALVAHYQAEKLKADTEAAA